MRHWTAEDWCLLLLVGVLPVIALLAEVLK